MDQLLLAGPEEAALKRLKAGLVKKGFRVKTAATSDELEEAAKERFALGVLDLEQGPGTLAQWVGRIRRAPGGKELPLLALVGAAHLDELTQVQGLEDFLAAPAALEGLEARIRFLLKRLNHGFAAGGMQIGDLRIDVERYEVSLEGEPLELTYKEFELLKFLATHPGRVYSRDQLLNQVWNYDFIGGTRTVDVHIRRLRAKLGPKHAALVDTVRNVGYKFLESL
jgi:DNA-binding response OmpR family regulator